MMNTSMDGYEYKTVVGSRRIDCVLGGHFQRVKLLRRCCSFGRRHVLTIVVHERPDPAPGTTTSWHTKRT